MIPLRHRNRRWSLPSLSALIATIGTGCGDGPITATRPFEVVALEVDHETEPVTGPLFFLFPDDQFFTLNVFGVTAEDDRLNISATGEPPGDVSVAIFNVDVVSFDEALGLPPGLLGYRFTIERSGTASIAFGYQPHPDSPALFEIVKVVVLPSSP